MNRLTGVVRGAATISLFAAAVVVATWALGQDGRPAGASHTEILASHSSSSASWTASIVLAKGGVAGGPSACSAGESDATTDCLYVWAKNVDNATGASAFQVVATYDAGLISIPSFARSSVWLGSTGRSTYCPATTVEEDPLTGSGEARASCNTLLPPPPWGATGTGLLAIVALESRSTIGSTTLNFSTDTLLVDTPPNPDDAAPIPAVVRSVNVVVAGCADFTGAGGTPDGTVRINDILYVVSRYFTPNADLDGDGTVRVNDILIAVQQYFAQCTR